MHGDINHSFTITPEFPVGVLRNWIHQAAILQSAE